MTCLKSTFFYSALLGLLFLSISCGKKDPNYPHPASNPNSALMLSLPDVGLETENIDYSQLPQLTGKHAVVSRGDKVWHYRLHTYLVYFADRYWCMWSHGPIVEDKPTQHIRFATSKDGIAWTEPDILVGSSDQPGFRHIARGFWLRGDGNLRALASHDEALKDGHTHFFGESLDLRSYLWNANEGRWDFEGIVFDDTINNFPPKKLKTGDWMMTRRTSSRSISFLVGGQHSISDWRVVPYSIKDREDGLQPEEPFWYELPDGHLVALARDNARSGRLLRSFSVDDGNSWTAPVRTNFPDATSKFNVLRISTGQYVMVNNANPERRNPLCLSVSEDGLVFTALGILPIPDHIEGVEWETDSSYSSTTYESLQYPHVIEHKGELLIAFSRKKQTVEVVSISLAEIEKLLRN
ncbi:MAG: exo-alpha-sialidase [Verrucomicrobia bacterium]|jgi:hypothetical protein|nr:exo-alpha-sialidase [Verrucomicrobiota bacterium]MDA1067432.1 exo-alpha-sialidase [Verrucomicrobiota bacterium]